MIDECNFRVGNEKYAKENNHLVLAHWKINILKWVKVVL